jgi:hypothetical protein
MLFKCNSDFGGGGGVIFRWLISAPRLYFAVEHTELFLILVNDDQAVEVPGMMAYCLSGNVRILSTFYSRFTFTLRDAFDTTDLCSS